MLLADVVENKVYNLAFDISLMRPGCVLIQAVKGCRAGLAELFNTETWLLSPTDDLRVYPTTGKQLKQLVAAVNNKGRTEAIER